MLSANYITPLPEVAKQFFVDFQGKGKITMLNLLKYKTTADYSELENLSPDQVISGKEAYKIYAMYTLPLIQKVDGQVLFFGNSKNYLIGPENEKWDAVLLVQYPSVEKFVEFSKSPEYLKTAGHRTAALEDSRLLPMLQNNQ